MRVRVRSKGAHVALHHGRDQRLLTSAAMVAPKAGGTTVGGVWAPVAGIGAGLALACAAILAIFLTREATLRAAFAPPLDPRRLDANPRPPRRDHG